MTELLHRHDANPVVTPGDVVPSHPGARVRGAFNPGATSFDGEVLLLLRVAEDVPDEEEWISVPTVRFEGGHGVPDVLRLRRDDPRVALKDTRGVTVDGVDYLSTMSHLRLARSQDGVHFAVDEAPFLFPADESERFGVEDARITFLEGRWWINYTAVSPDGWATALASTTDFRHVERHGMILHPENKDASIFPARIGDGFGAFHRPNNSGFGRPAIWYASSPDLLHWGAHRCVARPRDTDWEAMKIGGGAPSIRTERGWLQLYHGKGTGQRYSLWALLVDLDEPWRVLARGTEPILAPIAPYETSGFFPGVVFSNGVVQRGDELLVYYGAADGVTCLATGSITEILDSLGR